jgi:hypothetical protein
MFIANIPLYLRIPFSNTRSPFVERTLRLDAELIQDEGVVACHLAQSVVAP